MLIKRILFCVFIIGVISTIIGFALMRNSIREIKIYKDGKQIAQADKKDFKKIQHEIEAYANSGHKASNDFAKKEEIYEMKEKGSGAEIIYIEKTPAGLYIPADENGKLLYMVYAGSDGKYIDQPKWTSEKELETLQKIMDNSLGM